MRYLDALFDTPGVGGAVVCAAVVILIVCYGLTIKWISKGHEDKTEGH